MSSENSWIPWNEREDLEIAYIFENWWGDIDCICKNDNMKDFVFVFDDEQIQEFDSSGLEALPDYILVELGSKVDKLTTVVLLGKVPKKYLQEIEDKVWKACGTSVEIAICSESMVSEEEHLKAIQYMFYCEQGGKFNHFYKQALEAKRYFEDIDKRNYEILSSLSLNNKAIKPSIDSETLTVSDSPAIPAVPVAGVERPIGRNENYPSTWIYAKGDETAPEFTDNGAAGMIVAGNTARAADCLANIENVLYSINAKIPGRITKIEDIPPYNPTDNKHWVTVKQYMDRTGKTRNNLDSSRLQGTIAEDGKSGIHGEHIWRNIGTKDKPTIRYYVEKP